MNVMIATVILICVISLVEARAPNGRACFADQEISLFCNWEFYADAKKACENHDSYLVKIDNANMAKFVNSLIDKTSCTYWDVFIGATATPHPNHQNNGSKRIWKWLDGSKVYLPTESGYQNWQSGHPNDWGETEDCLIINKLTKQWKDSPCHKKKHYICQKELETKLEIKINAIPGGKQCLATAGSCAAHTEWRTNSETITQNSSGSIYQTSNLDSSILHHENATIGDAGNYTCTGWLPGDESDKQIASIELFVNGTPNVVDIKSFICNTSLLLQWAPHTRSVGFLHRILVAVSLRGAIVNVVEVTPNKSLSHFLEIGNLKPSTEYNVTVVACKERNNCSAEYAISKTATSSGIIVQVTNATLNRVTNSSYTCIVAWQWIYNMTETFQVFIASNSTETYNITKQSIFVKRNSYSFAPIPGYVYDVDVQPVTNGAYCVKTVKAVGTCFEKKFSENIEHNYVATIVVPLVIVTVLLLVVFSIVIYLRMRSPKPPQQTTVTDSGNVHDYATVGNPEVNDTGYMNLTDNFDNTAGKNSYENIDQNLSPTYETVKSVSEYEM